LGCKKMINKKIMLFWDLKEETERIGEKHGYVVGKNTAAYCAKMVLNKLEKELLNVEFLDMANLELKRKIRNKIIDTLKELYKAAKTYKGKDTGVKTITSRLRKQALQEIQNISNFIHVNDIYEETDVAESLFCYDSKVNEEEMDIYDYVILSAILGTSALKRSHKPRMKPLV